uniref:Uncharacterized protein n=1 Tax=Anthoceros punctatus TaxID=3234 RepID=A0A6M8B2E9_ANTPU|nr:hypothetical protein [Anthoceros punctatus]QKD76600.1 hypothetical protein [Anthoceros punctatus]
MEETGDRLTRTPRFPYRRLYKRENKVFFSYFLVFGTRYLTYVTWGYLLLSWFFKVILSLLIVGVLTEKSWRIRQIRKLFSEKYLSPGFLLEGLGLGKFPLSKDFYFLIGSLFLHRSG